MERTLTIYLKTDVGKRNTNQDNYSIDSQYTKESDIINCEKGLQLNCNPDRLYGIAIFDGVTNSDNGDYASQIAASKFAELLKEYRKTSHTLEDTAYLFAEKINSSLISVNSLVNKKMATTLSFILWKDEKFIIANIGDSPVYLINKNQIKRITISHTKAEYLKTLGKKPHTGDENILINYIGRNDISGKDMLSIHTGMFNEVSKILLSTDGLIIPERMPKDSTNESAKEFIQNLWKYNKINIEDNCTAILINVDRVATTVFNHELGKLESDEEFFMYLNNNAPSFLSWTDYINAMLNSKGLTRKDLSKYLDINEQTAQKFCKDVPSKRASVIMMAVSLNLNIEETNHMLEHKAKKHMLYPKNEEDAIWIYIINNKCWDPSKNKSVPELFNTYNKQAMLLKSLTKHKKNSVHTTALWKRLSKTNDSSFETYYSEVLHVLNDGYQKLIEYINYLIKAENCNNNLIDFTNDEKGSFVYYRLIKKLRNHRAIPSREDLIVLGLKLNLSVNGIDRLLDYAGMMPLYSLDPLESFIRYQLEEYALIHPEYFFDISESYADTNVGDYLKKKLIQYKTKFEHISSFKRVLKRL